MTRRKILLRSLALTACLVSMPHSRAEEDGIIGKSEEYTALIGDSPFSVQILENKTKRVVFDLGGDGIGSPYAAFFSENGSLIAFSCGTSSLGTRLFVYRLDGPDGPVMVDLPESVGRYITGVHTYMKTTRIEGDKVYFNLSNDGKAKPFVFDTKTGELREEK